MFLKTTVAPCALLIAAFATPAFAQSAPAEQAVTLDEVIVTGDRYLPTQSTAATRTDTPILLTPQSVQVVPRAVLNDQNALVLTDAVRNVAGVSTDFGFNGSTQPLLILRGFSATSMTALGPMSGISSYYLDGVKVSGLPVNMADVEQVEVVKGPNTVLYGRAEPGGIVNVVSRGFSPERRFSFSQTFGSYDLSRTTFEGGGAVNADRTLIARGSASYFTTKSNRDFVEESLGAVTGGLSWVPDADNSVSLTLNYADQKYRTDYGIPADGNRPADLPRSRQFNDAPELSSTESLSALLEARHAFNDDWEIKARGVVIRADIHEADITPYRFDYGLNPGQTCDGTGANLCRYYFGIRPDGDYALNQGTIELFGKARTGGWSHQLLFGVDAYVGEKSGVTYFQQITSVDVNNPVLGGSPGLDPALATPDDRLDRNRWVSVFAQDQIDLGGGLHAVLALRHDSTSAIYAAPGTEPNRVSFTTPRVGLVWAFKPGQSVYAQYQEALSANNGRAADGAALDPEKSRQTEVGYKYVAPDGRFIATLAAYELTKRNRADFSLFPIVSTIGAARSRGVELDVIGQVTSRFSVMGSYAYTETEVLDDGPNGGRRLANVPTNAGSLWGRYVIDQDWTVGGGVFYQGERAGDVGDTFQLPSYARVDLMASYALRAFGANTTLQLNVNNVFDELYYTGSHQFVSDWIQPGAPRTVALTLRAAF